MGIVAKIAVKRDANGLRVTLEAPELAKFVHEYCKQQTGRDTPKPAEQASELGPTWEPCNAAGLGRAATALSYITRYRPHDGVLFTDGDDDFPEAANLFMLRAVAAASGPVTYTFKGLFSKEAAQQYQNTAARILLVSYKELTSTYDKTVVIRLEEPRTVSVSGAL